MGLPPLEYTDCFLDSPNFREIISLYEKELEDNAQSIKSLVKECQQMIRAAEEFSKVQKSFATVLGNFTFQTIGEQTEDEKMISKSLEIFSKLLLTIEDYRHNMISTISVRLLLSLEKFRKEQIQKVRDEKKQFDKSTSTYYEALQKYLAISPRKKSSSLTEADSVMERESTRYRQSAFDYASKLQDVHAQKQYELIEPIVGSIVDLTTFLQLAHESACCIKPELQSVQFNIHILEDRQLVELEKTNQVKEQTFEMGEAGLVHHPEYLMQGNVFVQDIQKKVPIGTQWHRYFCQVRKKDIGGKKVRQIRFLPIGHQGNLPSQDFMDMRDCVRIKAEDSDRRFCFQLILGSTHGTQIYTAQATSPGDRRQWVEIVQGKEPIFAHIPLKPLEIKVDESGIAFVQKCIDTIESRGLEEEGLYRKPGVISKATKLVKECLEKGKTDQINLSDEFEWDTKTIASAIKYYLSKHLGEPLFTFAMHQPFIDAAKIPDHKKRLRFVRDLYEQLPPNNKRLTAIIIQHLSRVAAMSDRNLMKVSILGVCFGCIFMRPKMESVATTLDIKYQNIIIEILIENVEEVCVSACPPINPPSNPVSHTLNTANGEEQSDMKRNAQALYDCDAEDEPMELSFKKNEILYDVTQSTERGWLLASRADGKKGLVPSNYLEFFQPEQIVNTSSKSSALDETPVDSNGPDKQRPPPNPPGSTTGPPPIPKPRSKRPPETRGSDQLQKKEREEIAQATDHPSSENVSSSGSALRSSQDRVKVLDLEQQLQTAKQMAEDAEQRVQVTQQQLEDTQRRFRETEQQSIEAERRIQQLTAKNQEDLQRTEQRAQLAEQQLQDTLRQKHGIEHQLEGKTKELAAHNSEVWRIPGKNVSTVRKIGVGGWGAVFEGRVSVAVKELHDEITSPHNIERVQREMRLMAEVRHPNLVQFIGAVFDRSPPLIVSELLDMNLRQAYQQNRLRPGDRLSIFMDIAKALNYLHQRYEPIIHRDVSTPNILLQQMPNNQWKGKVSDLGSANFLQDAQTKGEGCILYSAPEVIPRAFNPRRERIPQTTKIDVYSYGILLCEVATSRFPSEENYWDMLESVRRDWPQLHTLIEQCTQERSDDRPTMETVLRQLSQKDMPQI